QQINGQVAAQANLPQGTMLVRVQLPPGTADTADALAKLPIPTAQGIVPLATLATIQLVTGPQTVNRVNGDRDATITATITANDTRAVQSGVANALNGVTLPPGVSISTGGVFAQLSTVLTQFALALPAAIGLVYLIMVATFRSLLKPLVLLAVLGGGGGIGGAFISRPLAIVVIGGLFTSTVLTLVLVPVLYSLASPFASRRSTADLDALLDAAEDRRFQPLGHRTGQQPAVAVPAEYAFAFILEPEPGRLGDRAVLEAMAKDGLSVEAVAGTAKVRIGVPARSAASRAEASDTARKRVRHLIPATGYRLSDDAEPVHSNGGP